MLEQAKTKATGTSITPLAKNIASQLPKPSFRPPEDFTTMSDEELRRIAGGR